VNIKKRGRNSWLLTIEIGRGPDGKRQRHYETFKGLRRDAEKRYSELLNELTVNGYQKPEKITLDEALKRYLRGVKHQVVQRTFERYEDLAEKHIQPVLGHLYINELQPFVIADYYEQLLDQGRLDGRGGLSPATIKQIHHVLRATLQQGVDMKLIKFNPASSVKPPRRNKKEAQFLRESDIKMILKHLQDNESEILIPTSLAANTGCRLSEVLGLKWSDIDFENRTLTVQRTLQQGKKGLFIGDVKSKSSKRKISLTEQDIAFLKRIKKTQAEQKLSKGTCYNNQDFICSQEDGSPMKPVDVSSNFRRAAKALGIQGSFHGLRHGHATILLSQGASLKHIATRLGHSSVSFTADVYAHVTISDDRRLAELYQKALKEEKVADESAE